MKEIFEEVDWLDFLMGALTKSEDFKKLDHTDKVILGWTMQKMPKAIKSWIEYLRDHYAKRSVKIDAEKLCREVERIRKKQDMRKHLLPLTGIKNEILPYSIQRDETLSRLLDALQPISRFHAIKADVNSYFVYYRTISRPFVGIALKELYIEISFFPLMISFPQELVPESLKAMSENDVSFQITDITDDLKNDIKELFDNGIKYAEWLDDLFKNNTSDL